MAETLIRPHEREWWMARCTVPVTWLRSDVSPYCSLQILHKVYRNCTMM
jgi:hypothetical protein